MLPTDPDAPEPYPDECVACYLRRVVGDHGCVHAAPVALGWAERFRDLRSPTAHSLVRRLLALGGCDCAVVREGLRPVREVMVRDLHTDELEEPERWPGCAGVGVTSSRPCRHWERRPRARRG
ncbi:MULTISPECIES: DUF2695 domain-containing protein [Nocardioides]|uniref:DUF2695 domain-containing protein n=1 Tax=Nocardioides salarius TaxID=374513 RepID=A0ABS2M873_9ACTN|nr:DUF2695 domain-containing protein [Nocardioides salarius]MBM7507402.1 hypothetical protein [Nocardioides salarius]